MITTTITPGTSPGTLYLGRVGENGTRQIVFDCSEFAEQLGAGAAELMAQLPDGATKYLPANVAQEDSAVTWTISSVDVQASGIGKAELSWYIGETVAKTITFRTLIRASLSGTGTSDPPDPYEDWVDRMAAVGRQATADAAAAQAAQEAAERAQGLAEDAQEAAEDAQEAAERAQGLAETAQGAAERAQGLAETAQGAAERAQGLAEDAQTAAETAQGLAEGAQTAAERAQGLAETAQGDAESARDSAQAAQTAIETMTQRGLLLFCAPAEEEE